MLVQFYLVRSSILPSREDYTRLQMVVNQTKRLLPGIHGLDQCSRMLKAMEDFGGVVNQTTGHHVHIGVETSGLNFRNLQMIAAMYIK